MFNTQQATFEIENLTVEGLSRNFLSALDSDYEPAVLAENTITDSVFRNIDSTMIEPFIRTDSLYLRVVGCEFRNITVVTTLIEANHHMFDISSTKFIDISKNFTGNRTYFYGNIQYKTATGICARGNTVKIDMFDSTFKNINSHCLFFEDSKGYFGSNFFDNSELQAKPKPAQWPEETWGVTWLKILNPSGYWTIGYGEFRSNKIAPIYGGVSHYQSY